MTALSDAGQKLRDMGFTDRAIRERVKRQSADDGGLIDAYQEDLDPHHYGLTPPFSARKSGRKRHANRKAAPRIGG